MDPGQTPDLGETWRNVIFVWKSTATASISRLQLRVQFLLLKTQTWLKYIHGEISGFPTLCYTVYMLSLPYGIFFDCRLFKDLPCDQHQSTPPLVIFIQLKASACWMAAWSISLSASSSSSKLHFSMDAIASKLKATRESRMIFRNDLL